MLGDHARTPPTPSSICDEQSLDGRRSCASHSSGRPLAQSASTRQGGTASAHGHSSEGMTFAPCASSTIAVTQVIGARTAHSNVPSAITRTRALRSSSLIASSTRLSTPKPPLERERAEPGHDDRATIGSDERRHGRGSPPPSGRRACTPDR